MTGRSVARDIALTLCKKHPEESSLMLARMLRKSHPVHFADVEQARHMVRRIRGATGKDKRSQAELPRERRKPGEQKKMPESLADPFLPFVMDGCKRVGVMSDIHVPYHSEKAWSAAVEKLKTNNCDGILINGDFCDFYAVSRFEKDPGARSFADELRICIEGLEWLRSEFPKARVVMKEGNHEERWDKFIWTRAPELYGVEACRIQELLKLRTMGIEYVQEQRPVMLGKLPALHGHELAKGIAAPVNVARGAYLRTQHTVVVGHSHRTSTHVEPDMWGREVAVWSTGCLCALNPRYNRFAKSNHGFAMVSIANDGDFDLENYRISKDWKVRTA